MTALCPECGHRLAPEKPLAVGELVIDPRLGQVHWKGRPVPFGQRRFAVLYRLVEAAPRPVSSVELMGDYDGDQAASNAKQHIYHIKRALPGNPIASHGWRGWSWA